MKGEASALRLCVATRADIDELSALRLAIFHEIGTAVPGRDLAFQSACRAGYERIFDEDLGLAWLFRAGDGAAVAALTLLFQMKLPSATRFECEEGYIIGVYTAPAWRGRGLATALLARAIEEARRRGVARIRLHATESGRRVYTTLGFQPRVDAMELHLRAQ